MFEKTRVVGYLFRYPQFQRTSDGTPVAKLTLACQGSFKEGSPSEIMDGDEVKVIAWCKLGENCFRLLTKGSQIIATGWQEESGEIVADTISWIRYEVCGEIREWDKVEHDCDGPYVVVNGERVKGYSFPERIGG